MNKSYPFLPMCTAKASAATPRITVGCAHMACGLNSHLIYVYDSNKLHGRPLYARGRSLTTLTKFCPLLTIYLPWVGKGVPSLL